MVCIVLIVRWDAAREYLMDKVGANSLITPLRRPCDALTHMLCAQTFDILVALLTVSLALTILEKLLMKFILVRNNTTITHRRLYMLADLFFMMAQVFKGAAIALLRLGMMLVFFGEHADCVHLVQRLTACAFPDRYLVHPA